jgi:hypothetical protein
MRFRRYVLVKLLRWSVRCDLNRKKVSQAAYITATNPPELILASIELIEDLKSLGSLY